LKRKLSAGLTSATLPIFIQDTSSATGAGLGSLVFNTASLVAEYRRQGESVWTSITLVTATLGTFASGGFIADGALTGAYEFHPPNVALASGARWVEIRLRGAANMLPVLIEIELDVVNYQSATAFMTGINGASYPSVVPGASGGLLIAGSNAATTFATLTSTGAFTINGNVLTFTTTNRVDASATVSVPSNTPTYFRASGDVSTPIVMNLGATGITVGTITLSRCLPGGSFAAVTRTFTATGGNYYQFTPDSTDVGTAGETFFVGTAGSNSGAVIVFVFADAAQHVSDVTNADITIAHGAGSYQKNENSTNVGPGSDACTLTYEDEDGDPIPDADAWITSDAAGSNIVAGTLQTTSDGGVTFLLDPGDTYYFWAQKDGFNSTQGQEFVAEAD